MDTEITPEQKAQLATWAGKRDAALFEISTLQIAKEKLQKENLELAASHTNTIASMNEIKGRIEELSTKERELPLLISKEVAYLESKKSSLGTEIIHLAKLAEVLATQKASLEKDVASALAAFDIVKGQSLTLEAVVDHVTRVSESNIAKIDLLVANLNKSLEEIIAVNRKNVFETNIVIDKLPRMLVEAQKHGLIKTKI